MTIKTMLLYFSMGLIFVSCKKDDEPDSVTEGPQEFKKYYGGNEDDEAHALIIDGEYIYAYGTSESFEDTNGDHYLIKTDLEGNLLLEKHYDFGAMERGQSLIKTYDGNLLLLGTTRKGFGGTLDIQLLKVSLEGELIWEKSYGGTNHETAGNLIETSQSEICIVGGTSSYGAGGKDMYILWLDQAGNVLREKTFGAALTDGFVDVMEIEDQSIMAYGYTYNFGAQDRDLMLYKLSSEGDSIWAKTYGGSGYEESQDFERSETGGFVLAGHTSSTDPDHNMYGVKVDENGETIWEQEFGGDAHDGGQALLIDPNGNYVFVARSVSFSEGKRKIYMVVTSPDGTILSTGVIGNILYDWGQDIVSNNSHYFIAGHSNSDSEADNDLYLVSIPIK